MNIMSIIGTLDEQKIIVNAVVNVIEKGSINEEEIIKWLRSFENIEITGTYPTDNIIKTHRRNFLLALYFRLKRRNNAKSLINVIDEVMDNITPNYRITYLINNVV